MAEKGPPAERLVGLSEAAERLRLHYMTVYRHVRLGRVPAERDGNRWLVREADLPLLTQTGRSRMKLRERIRDWGKSRRMLERRSLAGDTAAAWAVIENVLTSGASPLDVYVELIGPVMRKIGCEWARGHVTIEDEHRATTVALRLVGLMGPSFARRGPARSGTVVLGGAPGDRHYLPVAMVADSLRSVGVRVIDLGADVPRECFERAAERAPALKVVGVSVSVESCLGGAGKVVQALKKRDSRVRVIAGGPALASRSAALALGADDWAPDAKVAARLVVGLFSSSGSDRLDQPSLAHQTVIGPG